jgi:MarR family 2-MHQ and catechol resistance regulon transcriptional repressor
MAPKHSNKLMAPFAHYYAKKSIATMSHTPGGPCEFARRMSPAGFQEDAPPPSSTLIKQIFLLSSILERSANREAERHHVTLPQWLALGCIGSEGDAGITHSELCNRLMLSKAPVTGIVDRLVRDGYVQRTIDANDRRVTRIAINPSGIAVWQCVRDAMRDHAAKHCENFSEDELKTAITLLTRLTANIVRTDPTMAHCGGNRINDKTSQEDRS